MSLLTPPSTCQRVEKENTRPVAGPSMRRVTWSQDNFYFDLGAPPKVNDVPTRQRPRAEKSILKCTQLLGVPEPTKKREITPEPSDPLVDLRYLENPVNHLLDEDATLKQLIESYNILGARLRSCITGRTDANASWPLFQPLRKNKQAFVDAVIRDVQRALVDPRSFNNDEEQEEIAKLAPPTPEKTPGKKKGGLSAEQVKYGRDLSTTCQSTLKLINVIFSCPAVYKVFTDEQLRDVLSAILKILVATTLPTPNSRKTWAIAVCVIQMQRLPFVVIRRAHDRIAMVLQRAIDGEMGKEGKKGAISDGLKAVHDLSMHNPDVYVPAFVPLLPSVLANLLAPTLALRTQACNALGGFVLGFAAVCSTRHHARVAKIVAEFFTSAVQRDSPSQRSPTKANEPTIVRTLRTVMANTDPSHVAQGPVWGINVVICFIVLLGSRVASDLKIGQTINSLLSIGLSHKRSSVHALVCMAWRALAWAFVQPKHQKDEMYEDDDSEEEEEEKESDDEGTKAAHAAGRENLRRTLLSVVDCQAGVSTIATLLGEEDYFAANSKEALDTTIQLLQSMATKPDLPCAEAMEIIDRMVNGTVESGTTFTIKLLLPDQLFDAMPGILTAEWKDLINFVRPLYDQTPIVDDIRPLTQAELADDSVFDGLFKVWRTAIGQLELADTAGLPTQLTEVWNGLLRTKHNLLKRDKDALAAFIQRISDVLRDIVENEKLVFKTKDALPKPSSSSENLEPESEEPTGEADAALECSNGELRMKVVISLWLEVKQVFKGAALGYAAERLIECITENEKGLVFDFPVLDDQCIERARRNWLALCLDSALSVPTRQVELLKMFWGFDGSKRQFNLDHIASMWKMSLELWKEVNGPWTGFVVLLAAPFTDSFKWEPSAEDYSLWEETVDHTLALASEHGVDGYVVLDDIAELISACHTSARAPGLAMRLIDMLLAHLGPDIRDVPENLLGLVSETMVATYPPAARHHAVAMWMVRTLTTTIENCPLELLVRFLEAIKEGVCVWLKDRDEHWTDDGLTYDIVPLYQHILVRAQSLPSGAESIQPLSAIFNAPFTSPENRAATAAAVDSFVDFWKVRDHDVDSPPEGGWDEDLKNVLESVGLLAKEIIVPRTPISGNFSTPTTDVRRREALSAIPSPQRPSKALVPFPMMPTSPESPVQPRMTHARRIRLSSCSSPSKKRKLVQEDREKENISVSPAKDEVIPFAQRIADLVVGKKRSFEELHDATNCGGALMPSTPARRRSLKSTMKSRAAKSVDRDPSPARSVASTCSNESDDERTVEAALFAECDSEPLSEAVPFPRSFALVESNGQPKKKRTRCDSGAPTIPGSPEVKTLDRPAKRANLRRAFSVQELTGLHGKRKRLSMETDATDSDDEDEDDTKQGEKRLPALRIVRPLRKTYTLPSSDIDIRTDSPSAAAEPPSSDDDPRLGQVTPHHLISPAMKKGNVFRESLLRALTPRVSGGRYSTPGIKGLPTLDLTGERTKPSLDEASDAEPDLPGSDDSIDLGSSPLKAVSKLTTKALLA